MKEAIKRAIRACDVCQRSKGETVATPELLEPLPLPVRVWEDISMDFVEGLPMSHGKNAIMMVVNHYSKLAHFVPVQHPFSAPKIEQLFIEKYSTCTGC